MMPAAHADAFALKTLTAVRTNHHKTSTAAAAYSQPYNNNNNGTSNAYTQNSNDARSQSPSVVAARRSTNASVSSSQQVALLVKRSSAEHASQGAAAAAKEASAPSPYDTLVSHLKVRMRRWQWAVLPDGSLFGAQGPFSYALSTLHRTQMKKENEDFRQARSGQRSTVGLVKGQRLTHRPLQGHTANLDRGPGR